MRKMHTLNFLSIIGSFFPNFFHIFTNTTRGSNEFTFWSEKQVRKSSSTSSLRPNLVIGSLWCFYTAHRSSGSSQGQFFALRKVLSHNHTVQSSLQSQQLLQISSEEQKDRVMPQGWYNQDNSDGEKKKKKSSASRMLTWNFWVFLTILGMHVEVRDKEQN